MVLCITTLYFTMKFSAITIMCAIAFAASVTAQGNTKPCEKIYTEKECQDSGCYPFYYFDDSNNSKSPLALMLTDHLAIYNRSLTI